MLRAAYLSLVTLLLLLAVGGGADAARSHQQQQRRAFGDPQLVLSPEFRHGSSRDTAPKSLGEHRFTLRHIYHHGSHQYPHLHRYVDIPKHAKLHITDGDGESYEPGSDALRVRAQTTTIQRLAHRNESDINDLLAHAEWYGVPAELSADAWTEDEIKAPNVSDKSTVLTFAKMAANAYVLAPTDGEWHPVKGRFNYTDDFGWEADGLRGHVFADETNSTVVIGLKGTSPAVFDGSDTTGNDKLNDNLFGSCCCGQGGQYLWKQVCDCKTDTYTCNSTCLVTSLREKSHYYRAVRDLYGNVTERYPNSDVWLSGHSLGGVVSSLLGLTYGLPTLTFEAFPDAMAASRLGLPTPPGYKIGSHQMRSKTGIYHFGHTADPIYMGTCNGASSFCTIAGYAFEGLCHTGQTCIYDTVGDLGWRVAIGTHKISNVIRDVLEKYDTVPRCEEDAECEDCLLWKFYESNSTTTTTSSTSTVTSTSSRTRTETCKTPGWWGCLDESTTATPTTTFTTTVTSSTCLDPGWFGCRNETSTTFTSTVTRPEASPVPTITTTSSIPTSTSTSTSCKSPGFFGGCNDPTSTTGLTARPSSSASTTTATQTDE
ncbi:alpha beta-hydrolase [Lecanosticta acicola]|uniref:triacylglycerol lipase n=1 Tax=Lecanosticta acicola TaxID=111012 RepID=A0AAI9E7L2_9PEZI|nr:alpha beta-hydrolase [Lecanosticta acicola]